MWVIFIWLAFAGTWMSCYAEWAWDTLSTPQITKHLLVLPLILSSPFRRRSTPIWQVELKEIACYHLNKYGIHVFEFSVDLTLCEVRLLTLFSGRIKFLCYFCLICALAKEGTALGPCSEEWLRHIIYHSLLYLTFYIASLKMCLIWKCMIWVWAILNHTEPLLYSSGFLKRDQIQCPLYLLCYVQWSLCFLSADATRLLLLLWWNMRHFLVMLTLQVMVLNRTSSFGWTHWTIWDETSEWTTNEAHIQSGGWTEGSKSEGQHDK